MPVSFREVTSSNFVECIKLKVRDDQKFVASNVYSLAEAKAGPEWIPRAIYADETMVGFAMYTLDYAKRQLYLCRLMIDERYQHKGYGKSALDILKDIAMQDPGIDTIELSTKPDNAHGIKVYERFGFKDTGVLDDGEEVFILELEKHKTE